MRRRTIIAGIGTVATTVTAGCLGAGSEDAPPTYDEDDHESHGDAFREELGTRDVEVNDLLLDDDDLVLTLDYEHAETQQGLAEVSMAFVERIQGGWGVEQLEAIGRGEAEMTWHVEAEWAQAYADGDIDAEEYGNKISDTVEQVLQPDE